MIKILVYSKDSYYNFPILFILLLHFGYIYFVSTANVDLQSVSLEMH